VSLRSSVDRATVS